mgnify:FL=1
MKKFTFLFLVFVALILSCTKETIQFDLTQYYDVLVVLDSSNCTADCDEEADCEGQEVRVVGIIDGDEISTNSYTFEILDENDMQTPMVIRVDTMASPEIFAKITGNGDKVVRLQGFLEGQDGSGSTNCMREINLFVENPEFVRVSQ